MTDEQLDEGIKIRRKIKQYKELVDGLVTSVLKDGQPTIKINIRLYCNGSKYSDFPLALESKLGEFEKGVAVCLCDFIGKEIEVLTKKYEKL